MATNRGVSSLILSELYDAGDVAFVEMLLSHTGDFRPLLGLIEKWKKDRRAWATRLKIQFVLDPRARGQSRVVFKRLFKQAWVDGNHAVVGACMVSLDRSLRRGRSKRYRFSQGLIETTETLRLPAVSRRGSFSTPTLQYLRRRAWRYFRRLGKRDGVAYRSAIAEALARYVDDDVRLGENLLDNWGLMHACFGKSTVLTFNTRHTNLSGAGSLSELQAAPMFERHWSAADGLAALIDVLRAAQSRPVRIWAIQLLRRLHAASLPKIDAQMLLRLLDHADADVASFAAELLNDAQTVSSFPMTTWMDLLATRNPAVVPTIAQAFRRHVSFERATLAQAVELATRTAVPVATLGLEMLSGKTLRSSEDHRLLARLSGARCAAVGADIARFAVTRLNVAGVYQVDEVIAFFGSSLRTLRDGAFEVMVEESPGFEDPALWARLFESPYDDVRIELVNRLKSRAALPGASAESTASLWRTVLLNIHRGGRAKLSALWQISDRIAREPEHAGALLPVLVIAIRSVRAPEAGHGLAAIVSAVEQVPTLADEVKRLLPELQLDAMGAAQ